MLAVAVAAVAKLTGNLDKIIEFFGKYRPKRKEISEEQIQKLRQQLVDVILRQVVTRLEDSLHHKVRMDLRRQEEFQRVGRKDLPPVETSGSSDVHIHREFNPFDSITFPKPVEQNVTTASLLERADIQGRLLILGEPGAGKTNELLATAKELLQKAQLSDDCPLPVIFELSEWSGDEGKTFADWLTEQLQDKYSVPVEVAKTWVSRGQLFPLLDGLDELRRVDYVENTSLEELDQKRQAQQTRCMRAINKFLDLYPTTPMVVCCRRKEYETIEVQGECLKRLNGAIYLEPLNETQIQSYLNRTNRGPLWDILKNQPALLNLTRSPLFLLMLVVAYQGQPIQNAKQLLDLYIERQLNDLNNRGAYPPRVRTPTQKQNNDYLGWLATKLEEQEFTEFLIERLQPSWLELGYERKFFKITYGFLSGIWMSLLFSPFVGPLEHLVPLALLVSLTSVMLSKLKDIKVTEKVTLSWRKALLYSLILGLGISLPLTLYYCWVDDIYTGLRVGSILLLLCGLLGGILGILDFYEPEVNEKISPNQGVIGTAKIFLIYCLTLTVGFGFVGLILGGLLDFYNADGVSYMLFGGISFSVLGFWFALGPGFPTGLIRHVSLRFVLWRSGVAPWNYARFLEHAENHRFIQRVGGRYRFVHDLLRKRFAERYQPRRR